MAPSKSKSREQDLARRLPASWRAGLEDGALARSVSLDDLRACRPVYAVWEVTLKCDLKCAHCGSRAGTARTKELSTSECFSVIDQLARLGCREVTIIGGEAYLRKDWVELIRHVRAQGMDSTMTSGGRNLTEARVAAAAEAGLQGVSISIDGLEATHDRIRGFNGSWRAALDAVARLRRHGVTVGCNTQINALSWRELPQVMNDIIETGATHWQVQLTVAMGNAVDHPELLLQPYELDELYPMLAELYEQGLERGLLMVPGNNIGYFGPYEHLWRGGVDGTGHWIGCNAGQNTIGIEADGTIKGCPSLPTKGYAGGNVLDRSLEDIWVNAPELNFTRDRTENDLWGRCAGCYYADVCRGGCSWTSTVLFGKAGNNPYCHHRVLELKRQGLRERLVKVSDAPGTPFDQGLFAVVEEPLSAPVVERPPSTIAQPRGLKLPVLR
ncbi:MAG: radical SAM protein [Myxococcales bacterium]|nr:radical SAM protein [Myxococcales bacterium]